MLTWLFHENMSYIQALKVLFASLNMEKGWDEANRIRSDFAAVVQIITKMELGGCNQSFASYQI